MPQFNKAPINKSIINSKNNSRKKKKTTTTTTTNKALITRLNRFLHAMSHQRTPTT
jgi:hypothetical protein